MSILKSFELSIRHHINMQGPSTHTYIFISVARNFLIIAYFLIIHSFKKQSYLHGSSLNFVTPIDETRTILFSDEGSADTRFLTPSQSSINNLQSKALKAYIHVYMVYWSGVCVCIKRNLKGTRMMNFIQYVGLLFNAQAVVHKTRCRFFSIFLLAQSCLFIMLNF